MSSRWSKYNDPAYRKARTDFEGLPCHWCGGQGGTVDHLRAIAQGGTNARSNLVPACQRCNSRRGALLAHSRNRGRQKPAKRQKNKRW